MSVVKRVVVVGGGTSGTLVANGLRRASGRRDLEIVVLDRDDDHLFRPGLVRVPFGLVDPARLVRRRSGQLVPGVHFREAAAERVDLERRAVSSSGGVALEYDALVVASGATLLPAETDGLAGRGWMDRVFTFYSLDGASALRRALERFPGGRIAVAVIDSPVARPAAPLEFCFLADWFFARRGRRLRAELTYVTPNEWPAAPSPLARILERRGVEVLRRFATSEVDGEAGRLVSYDGSVVEFDLGVVVPLHGGAPYVGRSRSLGDEFGFVPTDPRTRRARAAPEVFVVGQASDRPVARSCSSAREECRTVVGNVLRRLDGSTLAPLADRSGPVLVETGFHRALPTAAGDVADPAAGVERGPTSPSIREESRAAYVELRVANAGYWRALGARGAPGSSRRGRHRDRGSVRLPRA